MTYASVDDEVLVVRGHCPYRAEPPARVLRVHIVRLFRVDLRQDGGHVDNGGRRNISWERSIDIFEANELVGSR